MATLPTRFEAGRLLFCFAMANPQKQIKNLKWERFAG
jgi:hypothetical protein